MNNINKDALQSKHIIREQETLWPWPWPDDLHTYTRFSYYEVVPAYEILLLYAHSRVVTK